MEVGFFLTALFLGIMLGNLINMAVENNTRFSIKINEIRFFVTRDMGRRIITNSKDASLAMEKERGSHWWGIHNSTRYSYRKDKKEVLPIYEHYHRCRTPLKTIYARSSREAAKAFYEYLTTADLVDTTDALLQKYLGD